MRTFFTAALFSVAVLSSMATSEAPPTGPGTVVGPWQASASAAGSTTLAPQEFEVYTLTVAMHADSVATIEASALSIYLSPSNQQAGSEVEVELRHGVTASNAYLDLVEATVELDDLHLDCTPAGTVCQVSYELTMEQVDGGRMDIGWFAEADVWGDGGVEAPISITVTQ